MLNTTTRLAMLEAPAGLVDVVIDSDAYNEIDDQFALAYALAAPEKMNVRAIYAAPFANARAATPDEGMEKSYQEILKLLKLAGMERETYRGSEKYLPDEKTPVISDAARDMSQRCMAYSPEKPLYVIALGAITNVASALLMNPEMADRVVIVWLGGHALEWPHNQEFNIRQDVAAARVVFASGAPLVMLPCMGVTNIFTTTGPELDYWLRGQNPMCDYLVQNTVDEVNTYAKGKVWSRVIWDAAAIGWLLSEKGSLMQDKLIHTPVPEYDHRWAENPLSPLCRYVYFVKRDALFGDMFQHLRSFYGEGSQA